MEMRICCLKGFAYGIQDGVQLDAIAGEIINANYDEFFWDGDLFRPDSFTRVVGSAPSCHAASAPRRSSSRAARIV